MEYLDHPMTDAHLPFLWLAGLLEAEGTFLRPAPSSPNLPIVSCRMTDRDVVERVATAFGVRVQENPKGPHQTEFAATIKGARAAALMRDLLPLMGERRQRAISDALAAHRLPARKLSYEAAAEIRGRHGRGESISLLAREFGVARSTIRQLVNDGMYREPPSHPWRRPAPNMTAISECRMPPELFWLAGWLEGEGSFMCPAPSDPRRPRVNAQSRDRDVIEKVACLLDVTPSVHRDPRGRRRGWSVVYSVLKRGQGAVELMLVIEPLMGSRRRAQIRRAVASWRWAGSVAPRDPVAILVSANTGANQIRRGTVRADVASRGPGLAS